MDRFIFTAASGAGRSLNQQLIHANNLANVNTEGFRADLEQAKTLTVEGYGYNSRFQANSENAGIDMANAPLRETGRDLDVGIRGDGLLALGEGGGEVYTRNGHIQMDELGNLTVNGRPLLGEAGPIQLAPFSEIAIGDDGTITVIPENGDLEAAMEVDRIKLVDIPADRLTKNDDGLLISSRGVEPRSENVQLANEYLETSNVSAINEMVATLSLSRRFEAQIKMMKAAEALAQAGNQLIRGS
ncbi:flagellar basal body rod protein FlgF [Erwinia sorbitola]|uniref:Flagellar basal-body rod protein FlgF n=1 Tax=Erwinia sorbitola TaxID=2681984 RepID=A0ABW9RBN1_9GAMM|nr:flagellar basal body rod protein FlgF [Erwinia sorbitola]MTD26955.1 flagellar hook-basal body complex protein [Erwinia sorbitola]